MTSKVDAEVLQEHLFAFCGTRWTLDPNIEDKHCDPKVTDKEGDSYSHALCCSEGHTHVIDDLICKVASDYQHQFTPLHSARLAM